MTFSSDAIGFYLQADNQLSGTLKTAAADYAKFVGQIEAWNKRAYKSATSGMGQLGALVDGFKNLPNIADNGYRLALKRLRTNIKPLVQPLTLVFTAQAQKGLQHALSTAVSAALSRSKVRLTASMPQKRLAMFDSTVSLRAAYNSQTQPPDMLGKFQAPKRFRKGGIVDGPNAAMDSVLALLQPGELVVPQDITAKLTEMAGSLREEGGKFAPSKDLKEALAEIENLASGLKRLKGALDAGLGDPKMVKLYHEGVATLNTRVGSLGKLTEGLATRTRVRLAPAIEDATKALAEFREEGEETSGVMKKLLRDILGPVRFLAVSRALTDVSESMGNLRDGARDTFSELSGDGTDSFISNVNNMNRFLNLTRQELRLLKQDALDAAKTGGAELNLMGEAMESLAEEGVRDRNVILRLAPAIANMATATNASAQTLADVAFKLEGAYGFTGEQIEGTFDNIRMFAATAAIDAEKLTAGLATNLENMSAALLKETSGDQQQIISNMARLSAALSDNWQDAGDNISGVIGRALGGEQDAIVQMSRLLGEGPEKVMERLRSGDLQGVLDGLQQQVQAFTSTGNLAGLDRLRELVGFEGTAQEFALLANRTDDFKQSLQELGQQQHTLETMGDAASQLATAASHNRTIWERVSDRFNKAVGSLDVMGVSGLEVVDMIKEMNASTLLSIGFLAKWGLQAAVATGKFLGLGGTLGKVGGLLGGLGKGGKAAGGLSTVTSAAGQAGKAAGTGGFFAAIAGGLTTLAGGLTTFGAAMIGPGGIGLAALLLALLGIATAARIATPVFEILGDVLMHVVDGFVEMFKHALDADPRNLLLLGPAMFAGAAGVTAMAGALVLYGGAMAASAAGVAAFRLAAGLTGGLKDGVVVSTITALIGTLSPLESEVGRLERTNRALSLLVTFLGDFSKVGVALAAIGAGTLVGSTVSSFLSFFGVKSPMQLLADGSGGMADTLLALVSNMERLAQFGEGRLAGIARTMRDMVSFMADYATLAAAIEGLPGTGVLNSISDSVLGFFGVGSPAEKLAAQAGPIAQAIGSLMGEFEAVNLRQNAPSPVTPQQLSEAVEASLTLKSEHDTQLHDDMLANTAVLRAILAAVQGGNARQDRQAPPTQTQGGSRKGSAFTKDVAGFDF